MPLCQDLDRVRCELGSDLMSITIVAKLIKRPGELLAIAYGQERMLAHQAVAMKDFFPCRSMRLPTIPILSLIDAPCFYCSILQGFLYPSLKIDIISALASHFAADRPSCSSDARYA